MPKPWELDWSTGAPAPDAMPLPIVPFFGRQRPPMLGDGGVAIDPSTVAMDGPYRMPAGMDPGTSAIDPSPALSAANYGMIARDPVAMRPPGAAPAGAGDTSSMQAAGPLSESTGRPSATPPPTF